MPDEPDRSHDTDPLADTQASGETTNAGESTRIGAQRRSVRAGDTLGRYELVGDVGEGGMATVYRARDKELRREVAVKVLFPHLARREEVVRRFHREARAAAGLEHPNILRVYDVGGGETDDPPYIVMELVRGHSLLGELERRGPLLAEVAACLGALLADALAVAHKAGIIHRDIKPANVMIDAKGRVLLADFGVARLETEDSLVTKTGALLGTPAYMSPEQASGDTATAKSDLYSLGATLYQLSTGQLPYAGSPAKVMAQIAQGSLVSAVRKRASVGPDLSRVIDRLMATDPSARPSSAAEVASELRALASAAGFGEPAEELASYFADPDAFVKQKTPAVVATIVAAARRAIADSKLPRAMALAGRASALAPDDPAVLAVVDAVTEGGRSSRRRRILAIVGVGVIAAGGATFGVMQLVGEPSTVAVVADAAPADAIPVLADAGDAPADGMSTAEIEIDAGVAADAAIAVRPRTRDAGVASVARRDAAVASAVVQVDARATAVPADAAIALTVPGDAAVAAAPGYIIVKNDTWCDVTIDDRPRGGARNTTKPLAVDAGRHTVQCEQKAMGNAWTKHVEVAAGQTVTVEGSMLGRVEVTLGVDATIDGTPYRKGQVIQLKAARHELVVGGAKIYATLTRDCTVRSSPEVGCY